MGGAAEEVLDAVIDGGDLEPFLLAFHDRIGAPGEVGEGLEQLHPLGGRAEFGGWFCPLNTTMAVFRRPAMWE